MLVRSANGVLEHVSQSAVLFEIEETANFIAENYFIYSNAGGQIVNRERFNPAYYLQLFEKLPRFFSVYDKDCTYANPIANFLIEGIRRGINHYPELVTSKKQCFEWVVLDDFVRMVAKISSWPLAKSAPNRRKNGLKENNDRLIEYAKGLHHDYARLFLVRIDFSYRKECLNTIDVKTFYKHLDMLAKRIETKGLFNHLAGHARSLEQAKDRAYHCHAALYFKGDKHQSDYLAKQIGDIWIQITKGQGSFYSPNLDSVKKEIFKKQGTLGIGMIRRDQPHEVQNAINAISYLTRPDKDQHLRMVPKGRRTFFTGIAKK